MTVLLSRGRRRPGNALVFQIDKVRCAGESVDLHLIAGKPIQIIHNMKILED